MKATRFSLTFIALALCGSGHAGPCKPRSSTALVRTTSTEATLSASTEISSATSVAESSTTDLSSKISESITSTATSDSYFSSTTELLSSSVTTETATATTSAAELSSTTETLSASTTLEATTTEAPTTTTAEVSVPSNLFLNPSFDEPGPDGDYNGSPWAISDSNPSSFSIRSDLAHFGSHSAYWSIIDVHQVSLVSQPVALESYQSYTLSYWWYIDDDAQPQNFDCYIVVDQTSTDGLTSISADFYTLSSPLPLKTWTKRQVIFNSLNIVPAELSVSVICGESAGTGIKVAVDDVYVAKRVT